MYKIIDGKAHSAALREEIARRVISFKQRTGKEVGLAVIMAGDDPASKIYVKNKVKACEQTGIKSFNYYLEENVSQEELESLIKKLSADENVHGILVQLPLPANLNAERALKLIPKAKDVDGFCEENIGALCLKGECTVACTPNGVMKMLEREHIQIAGKNAVVIGRSNIVGKPMAMLLLNADATVTVCHSKTQGLKDICARADILVAAIGKPRFVKADFVKEGAVVIDVGMNRSADGKLCGDVDFEGVKDKCSHITPVPGGVGPMTITMLLYNTILAAERS